MINAAPGLKKADERGGGGAGAGAPLPFSHARSWDPKGEGGWGLIYIPKPPNPLKNVFRIQGGGGCLNTPPPPPLRTRLPP